MIINTAPQHEAILSNVNQVSNFAIKATAKSFHILSSGLYANKIRAVIRELCCNAHDSHVAAKNNQSFDLHLPTAFEPWFAVRDYGVGLSREQVTQIYTTYFESTKTNSNEFIGALGLGSKSPFSYTDNFTVTAIKDGKKGVYSAFINNDGVPSIALMDESISDDATGVEVRFAVNTRNDFDKFRQEAQTVLTHFAPRPNVVGPDEFAVREHAYDVIDIVPGVHSYKNASKASVAVMGNIEYPISVPNPDSNLGQLAGLLACGLELHFKIGELDFQASREGLSYIPQTIEAICNKLTLLNTELLSHLKAEADNIENEWEQALFVQSKVAQKLWHAAAIKYIANSNNRLFNKSSPFSTSCLQPFELDTRELATKYNIEITGFVQARAGKDYATLRTEMRYINGSASPEMAPYFTIGVRSNTFFVINDTKIGATQRAIHHWRHTNPSSVSATVVIFNRADKTKPMRTDKLLDVLVNPPHVQLASTLIPKPTKRSLPTGEAVRVVRLARHTSGFTNNIKWVDAGTCASFDSATVHYYLPLSGFALESEYGGGSSDVTKNLVQNMGKCGIGVNLERIYGIRKADMSFIKTQPNWINLEEHVISQLNNTSTKMFGNMVVKFIDLNTGGRFKFHQLAASQLIHPGSPMREVLSVLNQADANNDVDLLAIRRVYARYAKKLTNDTIDRAEKLASKTVSIMHQYPMLQLVSVDLNNNANRKSIMDYINMVDQVNVDGADLRHTN